MTKPLNNIIIGIDNGHGGKDSGAVAGGIKEKDITLSIGKGLARELRGLGAIVIESRNNDRYVSLDERRKVFNNSKTDIVVSLHTNYYNNKNSNGLETYFFEGSSKGKKLAEIVQNQLMTDKIFKSNRGIKKGNHLYIVRRTLSPTILVELGFISNITDRSVLVKEQSRIIKSLVKGIAGYYGKAINRPVKPNNQVYYRVIAGSYKDRYNADRQVTRLKNLGIDGVFIDTFKK